jgi:hypothetical protein
MGRFPMVLDASWTPDLLFVVGLLSLQVRGLAALVEGIAAPLLHELLWDEAASSVRSAALLRPRLRGDDSDDSVVVPTTVALRSRKLSLTECRLRL